MNQTIFPDHDRQRLPARARLSRLLAGAALFLAALQAAPAQVTVFSEDFEGAFPGAAWSVGDMNSAGPPAYWGKVDAAFGGEGAHSGDGKAYCAGVGFDGDIDAPLYRDEMWAFMRATMDLRASASATLSFWYKAPANETCCDQARVLVGGALVWATNNTNSAWTQVTVSLDSFVGMFQELSFEFRSDASVTFEGFYVDDIAVTGATGPSSDSFDGAAPLTGAAGRVAGNNSTGTKEAGEPNHAFNEGGPSIWYRWTAPSDGAFVFSTYRSSFDTLLGVYTGSNVAALSLVATNDDAEPFNNSRVSFTAVSGTEYRIVVDGYDGASGPFTLNWAPDRNDFFAAATLIAGDTGTLTNNNTGFTKELGEPNHVENLGGRSAWYRWTAPAAGRYAFRTTGGSFNTLLAVYTGEAVAGLTTVALNNDEFPGRFRTSRTSFFTKAGKEYWIVVDGFRSTAGAISSGTIVLIWAPDDNDSFAAATEITGSAGTLADSNVGDTFEVENGEPGFVTPFGQLVNGRTVWYRWTAPTNGGYFFSTAGSSFDTVLFVFTGTNLPNLTLVTLNDEDGAISTSRLQFVAAAGTTYYIEVSGYLAESGAITLTWGELPDPDLTVWAPSLNPRIETRTFTTNDCEVVDGLVPAGARRLLRFTTEVRNGGFGDFILGDPSTEPGFSLSPCDGTYRFESAAAYRLFSGQTLVAGRENAAFCLFDGVQWDPNGAAIAAFDCGFQGLQHGWAVVQDAASPGQFIDITGLPPGDYTLEVEVDPANLLAEVDDFDVSYNNFAQVTVTIPANANDAFTNATPIVGVHGAIDGDTTGASKEPLEPGHANNSGGHSVWFCWTAPGTNLVTFFTQNNSFDTLLAVYTGTNLGGLAPVAENNDFPSRTNGQSQVSFVPVAGQVYWIAVDGVTPTSGAFTLAWSVNPLLQVRSAENGDLIVTLIGVAGQSYELQASLDLISWTPLQTVLADDPPTETNLGVTDPPGYRFIRALLQ